MVTLGANQIEIRAWQAKGIHPPIHSFIYQPSRQAGRPPMSLSFYQVPRQLFRTPWLNHRLPSHVTLPQPYISDLLLNFKIPFLLGSCPLTDCCPYFRDIGRVLYNFNNYCNRKSISGGESSTAAHNIVCYITKWDRRRTNIKVVKLFSPLFCVHTSFPGEQSL